MQYRRSALPHMHQKRETVLQISPPYQLFFGIIILFPKINDLKPALAADPANGLKVGTTSQVEFEGLYINKLKIPLIC